MKFITTSLVIGVFSSIFLFACQSQNSTNKITQSNMEEKNINSEFVVLGGGCFWCLEAVYQDIKGVIKVESGYSGGKIKNPTYKEVCSGLTGHAEVVKVTYDPKLITFSDLIEIFWHIHDPTTLNRQGNDAGTQYRSVIFYANEEQKRLAEESKFKATVNKIWPDPIVTTVEPLNDYYPAEDYHQNYFKNNPNQPYCIYVVNPKVQKFKKEYSNMLK